MGSERARTGGDSSLAFGHFKTKTIPSEMSKKGKSGDLVLVAKTGSMRISDMADDDIYYINE